MFENALGPAYFKLLDSGKYSDLAIEVNGETFNVHKCILISRSEKFKVMLLSERETLMSEQILNKMVVKNPLISSTCFRAML